MTFYFQRALRRPFTCVCFDKPERSLPAPLALDGKRRCLFVKIQTTFCPGRSSAGLPGLLHKAHAACQGCWGSFGSVFGTSSRAMSSARGKRLRECLPGTAAAAEAAHRHRADRTGLGWGQGPRQRDGYRRLHCPSNAAGGQEDGQRHTRLPRRGHRP